MQRLLVIGYGDIARRAALLLAPRFTIAGVSRQMGFDPDQRPTLTFGEADGLLHCAPPPPEREHDSRTANPLAPPDEQRALPRRGVSVSTSGVYGELAGERVAETPAPNPETAPAPPPP